jgi:hypothetical protein
MFCSGLRIVHNLPVGNDYTTLVITRERSIYNYLFTYWCRRILHLLSADEELAFQLTWSAYLNITSPDTTWLRTMSFQKNSIFLRRLREQATYCIIEWIEFDNDHIKQNEYLRKSICQINLFIYKYILLPAESY